IFVWKARTIVEMLELHEPERAAHLKTIAAAAGTSQYAATLERKFAAIKGESIDYAVMERAADIAVVEATFRWDDLGSWQALARLRGTDENGNTLVGKQVALRTHNSIVRSSGEHLIVTLGVSDCLVVHTSDATLVANRH